MLTLSFLIHQTCSPTQFLSLMVHHIVTHCQSVLVCDGGGASCGGGSDETLNGRKEMQVAITLPTTGPHHFSTPQSMIHCTSLSSKPGPSLKYIRTCVSDDSLYVCGTISHSLLPHNYAHPPTPCHAHPLHATSTHSAALTSGHTGVA